MAGFDGLGLRLLCLGMTPRRHLCEGLADMGISMYFKMLYPSYPTIMDVALDFDFSDDKLRELNNARIHERLIHFGAQESYTSVAWPRRKVSVKDIELLKGFIKNSMPSVS